MRIARWIGVRKAAAAVMATAIATGCGGSVPETPERTDRERDSLIAQSALPHASGVGAALGAQDKQSANNALIDSIASTIR